MKIKTIIAFLILFSLALGLNVFSRLRNFSASNGPVGDGEVVSDQKTAQFNGEQIQIPENLLETKKVESNVLGQATGEKWIEIDLSDQYLKAWQGNTLYVESPVSTGLPWTPTPTGEFRIWIKLRATRMEGGSGAYYYNLPNVPYTMFFENDAVPGWRGFGLHGTYWHNDFGRPHSHGCVNLPTPIAEKLYYWVEPDLRDAKWSVRASDDNPGTKIVIHE